MTPFCLSLGQGPLLAGGRVGRVGGFVVCGLDGLTGGGFEREPEKKKKFHSKGCKCCLDFYNHFFPGVIWSHFL